MTRLRKLKKHCAGIIGFAMTASMAACGSDSDEPAPNPPVTPDLPEVGVTVPNSVIYQVNPRFYGDTDCLKAVTADIPRIAGMGCDILWVMPVQEIGRKNSIGSPYCIRDYKSVGSKLGTMEDFKTLVATAHGAGMKVILDWVANHTAWDNVWTVSNPERYAKDANGDIAATSQWNDVAQLDYKQTSTRQAMTDALLYWVETASIDGFRCDYAEGVPHDYWKEAISSLRSGHPDLIMLAESNSPDFYQDGFDMVYDWNFSSTMKNVFAGGKPSALLDFIADRNSKIPSGKTLLRYAFNHDVAAENDVDRMYGAPEGTVAAYALAAFSGATPMVYSSMDVDGLKGKLSFFSHRTLRPSAELTARYAAINKAFKASAAARGGKMTAHSATEAVVFSYANGGKNLLVMVNPSGDTRTVRTPIAFRDVKMNDLISGQPFTPGVTVELPAYGYLVLMN